MSNEFLPSTPASGPASGESARPTPRNLDAELVLAAVARMEATIGRGRGTLDRLCAELAALAQTIARTKIAMRSGGVKSGGTPAVAALLDEIEHRVDAMLEIGGRPRAQDAPARDQSAPVPPAPDARTVETPEPSVRVAPARVPTVSDVVWRLGRADEQPREGAEAPRIAAAARDVFVMDAMVQALSALDAGTSRGAAAPAGKPEPKSNPASRAGNPVMPDNELRSAPARTPATGHAPPGPRPDPLAPLHAMSAAEKIALFS
jgi:hypothetical protein